MTETTLGGGAQAASTSLNNPKVAAAVRIGLSWLIFGALLALAFSLHETPGRGAAASLSLLIGVALGVIFQRGRFCFFCILRDFIEHRNSSGMFAILSALAVGGIGYVIVFGAFMPNPSGQGLPPDAHIGPVSWVLVAGGAAFGLGMALSGACISGHLYRLGEGYTRAPIALFGSLLGFGVGFLTWHTLYVETISTAPIAWLPKTLGYGGSLAVHLAALSALACLLLRYLPELPAQAGGKITWQKTLPDRVRDALESAGDGRASRLGWHVRLLPRRAARRHIAIGQPDAHSAERRRAVGRSAAGLGYVCRLRNARGAHHHQQRAADRRFGGGLIGDCAFHQSFSALAADLARRVDGALGRRADGLGRDGLARLHGRHVALRHLRFRDRRLGLWRSSLRRRVARHQAALA
jgi:uncharacterized membrane protein YedE/YeeE